MTHQKTFVVDAVTGRRFEVALDLLRSGDGFEFQKTGFRMSKDGALVCGADSAWDSENVTATTAAADFDDAKIVLEHLLEASPAFAAIVRNKPVRYVLEEDDGDESILICSKSNDLVTWEKGFPRVADTGE